MDQSRPLLRQEFKDQELEIILAAPSTGKSSKSLGKNQIISPMIHYFLHY